MTTASATRAIGRRPGPVPSAGTDRRAARKARTRRDIYEAAMRLFSARGFDAVTIEEICEAAGCAKATFFLHFASKAALIEEFNAHLVERLSADMETGTGSAEARLRRLVAAFIAEYRENAAVMRQMAREFLNQPALVPAADAANREVVDLVAQIVRDGQATGEFAPGTDPALAATALVSTWGAFTARWSGAPTNAGTDPGSGPGTDTDMDVEGVNDALLALILGGLKPR